MSGLTRGVDEMNENTECCSEQDNDEIYICTDEELEAFEKFHAERVAHEDQPTQEEMDDLLPIDEDGTFVGGSYYTWDEYKDLLR